MKRLILRALIGLACFGLAVPSATAGVLAYYSFDTNFADNSGNGRDGTFVDSGTIGNSGITNTAGNYIFGSGGLNITGESGANRDYVSVTPYSFTSASNYSISFWARKSAGDTGGAFTWDLVMGDTRNNNNFLGFNDGTQSAAANSGIQGTFRFRAGVNNGVTSQSDWVGINENDYTWHHHAIVMDGTADAMSYYLDGVLVNTQTGKTSTAFTYNAIGAAYDANSDFDFRGQLDEFWIFDQALTGSEVSNLMTFNNIAAVPEPATIAVGMLSLGWVGIRARRRGRN